MRNKTSKIHKGVKNLVLKPVLYTGIAAMTLIGCNKSEVRKEVEKTYFENWGFVDDVIIEWNRDPVDIEVGDFDGDGDLDIAVATGYGGLRLYENRIANE